MTKPSAPSTSSTARPPPPPSARSIYLSAVDAFKASVFSSPTASSPTPPPRPRKDRSALPGPTSTKNGQKQKHNHKPTSPPRPSSTINRSPSHRPQSATVSDASSSDEADNLGSGRLAKHQHARPGAESDSDEDSDGSWASSSDGEPTEQLPGSFWRPSDKSSSSDDEDDASDSDPDDDDTDGQGQTEQPQPISSNSSSSHSHSTSSQSSSSTMASDDALTSDAANHSHSDSMTESSSDASPLLAQQASSSSRQRRKTAGPGTRGNLSIQTGTSVNDRRDQARLLLVSLLENFCMLYSPDENRLLFQILCEKLSAMGIITEADYNDHFSTVRGIYKRAFKELVFQALVATRAARDGQPRMKSSGSLLLEYSQKSTAPASRNGAEVDESSTDGSASYAQSDSSSSDSEDDSTPTKQGRSQQGTSSSSDDGINSKSRSSLTQMPVKKPVRANSNTSALSDSVTVNPARAAAAAAAGLADLLDLHTTRYRTDFDEIRRLGRGGFGSVWHVRHRLDGREYAIKKVTLNNPKDFDRVLREVKVLARMDHPNIVRYHSAWLEHDEVSLTKPVGGGGAVGAGGDDTFATDSMDLTTSSARLDEHSHASSSAGITFARDSQAASANTFDAEFASDDTDNDDDDDDDEQYHDPNSAKQRNTTPTVHASASPSLASPSYRPLTLFIQMELCYSSLHDYLLHRNTLRHLEPAYLVAETNFLFSAMLVALEYIHERGTSHRDLTPRNLFLARKPGQYLRAAKARATANGAGKVQRGNGGTLAIDDEAALPLCEWLKVGSLDDISIKIGDFGLVTEHSRRSDTSVFTTPTHSPSSVRAPWAAKLNGASSAASPETSTRPRILPEPAGRTSPSATSEDDEAGIVGGDSSFIMPRPLPPPNKPPVPRLPPGVVASVPPRSSSPRSPVQGGPTALATPPLAPSTSSATAAAAGPTGSSPIVPPIRLPPHLRRLPSHAPTLGIGTATYSAPEQIARSGSSKYRWHPITSDMFSLGVILLELLQPFSTGMERLITLERLRAPLGADRTLPPEFISQFPQYAAMVLWLTAEDPAHRPTPSELLGVFPPPVPDAIATASGGGSSRGSARGSNRGLARNGRRGSNASIGSNGTTSTRGQAAAIASDSEIARLRKIIDEQNATIADRDRVIDDLRSRLEALHVRLGPPPTPPRATTPELGLTASSDDRSCTSYAPPLPPFPRQDV